MICPNCKSEVKANAKFCTRCGLNLAEAAAEEKEQPSADLADKGYEIDLSMVEQSVNEFDSSYRERIINTFDEFTTREAWSRTESWNLMKDTDSMYDYDDLDNPIRQPACRMAR
ncbi:MAG: zinc ribbon domain-containing protein [Lachnospiraceae bacterium]|nr:zinc ribbon domain-containing protein [Lachnospiraceae bacterium]